jgi:hypothetical protein
MSTRVGARLRSSVCDTEVVVVRSTSEELDLRCGGSPLLPLTAELPREKPPIDPAFESGTLLGKRYVDEAEGIEVLCTKPGRGTLALGETPLQVARAKPLPASD